VTLNVHEVKDVRELNGDAAVDRVSSNCQFLEFALAFRADKRIYRGLDALARAYGPWWLCNDVTRPFWSSGRKVGPEREVGMVAIRLRGVVPCLDANLRGTRQRGRGSRVIDPSSLN
jgi:hypothetical protein